MSKSLRTGFGGEYHADPSPSEFTTGVQISAAELFTVYSQIIHFIHKIFTGVVDKVWICGGLSVVSGFGVHSVWIRS